MCISFLASRSANPKDYRAPHRHNGAEAWTGNLELQSGRFAHTPHPMVQGWGAAEKSTRITSGVLASRRFVLSEGKLITNSMNIWVSENCLSYPIRTNTHAQFDLNKSDVPPFTSRLRVVFLIRTTFHWIIDWIFCQWCFDFAGGKTARKEINSRDIFRW